MKGHKHYARHNLETRRRPDFAHSMVWRPRWALETWWRPNLADSVAWRPRGALTLPTWRRSDLAHSMIRSPRGAQTLRAVWFGDMLAPKPCAQHSLETQRRPKLAHSVVWRQKRGPNITHAMNCRPRPNQALRTVWIGDPEGPRPCAQHGFESWRRPNNRKLWRPHQRDPNITATLI